MSTERKHHALANRAETTGSTHDGLPRFLTADEVATLLLRTTRRAVYVMAERGRLPGVTRIGRRILFRTDVLLDWLRQKSAPSPKE